VKDLVDGTAAQARITTARTIMLPDDAIVAKVMTIQQNLYCRRGEELLEERGQLIVEGVTNRLKTFTSPGKNQSLFASSCIYLQPPPKRNTYLRTVCSKAPNFLVFSRHISKPSP
jgi:hypothetical protein